MSGCTSGRSARTNKTRQERRGRPGSLAAHLARPDHSRPHPTLDLRSLQTQRSSEDLVKDALSCNLQSSFHEPRPCTQSSFSVLTMHAVLPTWESSYTSQSEPEERPGIMPRDGTANDSGPWIVQGAFPHPDAPDGTRHETSTVLVWGVLSPRYIIHNDSRRSACMSALPSTISDLCPLVVVLYLSS